jgi:hypothetical protein
MQDVHHDSVLQVAMGGDKAVRRRVLNWLHAGYQPAAPLRDAGAVPGSSMLVAAQPVSVTNATPTEPLGSQDVPVHKRAAKMWKRCEYLSAVL